MHHLAVGWYTGPLLALLIGCGSTGPDAPQSSTVSDDAAVDAAVDAAADPPPSATSGSQGSTSVSGVPSYGAQGNEPAHTPTLRSPMAS